MRIDYSEPKKSYISTQQGQPRTRKEPSGSPVVAICVTAVLSLSIGFGSGWMLSQRATKKGFAAATAKESIENSTSQAEVRSPVQPTPQLSSQPTPPPSADKQQMAATAPQPPSSGSPAATDPPLSFYKTLPSGQKSNVLGSGINSKDEKPAKASLQAAIPSNVVKQPPQQPVSDTSTIQPAPVPAKSATRPEPNGYVVQAASYSLKSEAETLKNKLASKGYNAYISESQQGDKGTWYRVRVGKKLEQDAARELAGKLGKGAIAVPDKE